MHSLWILITCLLSQLATTLLVKIPSRRFSEMKLSSVHGGATSDIHVLPSMVVFDLDMCVWSPEMYTLDDMPSKPYRGRLIKDDADSEGVISVSSGYESIRLFPGALQVLQEFEMGKYPGMRLAIASSADTPRAVEIGRAALDILEVLPGVTVRQIFRKGWEEGFEGNVQIGRSPPLTSDKATTHFPIIQSLTQVPYNEMLFFDDCIWGDHCDKVARKCPGVVTQRTPRGLQYSEWVTGLQSYNKAAINK